MIPTLLSPPFVHERAESVVSNVLLTEKSKPKKQLEVKKIEPLKVVNKPRVQQAKEPASTMKAETTQQVSTEPSPTMSMDPLKEYNKRWRVSHCLKSDCTILTRDRQDIAHFRDILNSFSTPQFFFNKNAKEAKEQTQALSEGEKGEKIRICMERMPGEIATPAEGTPNAKVKSKSQQLGTTREKQSQNRQSTPSDWEESDSEEDVPERGTYSPREHHTSHATSPSAASSSRSQETEDASEDEKGPEGSDVEMEDATDSKEPEVVGGDDPEFLQGVLKTLASERPVQVKDTHVQMEEVQIKEEEDSILIPMLPMQGGRSTQERSTQDEESTLEDSSYRDMGPPPGQPRRRRSDHGSTSSASQPRLTETQLREAQSSLFPSYPSSGAQRSVDAMEVDFEHGRGRAIASEEKTSQTSLSSTSQSKSQPRRRVVRLKPPKGWKWPTWEEIADDLLFSGQARHVADV